MAFKVDGGIEWEKDTTNNIVTIRAASSPASGYSKGYMKDYEDVVNTPWGKITDSGYKVKIERGVKYIGASGFALCIGLVDELVIPNTVVGVGYNAFFNCHNLTGVRFMGPAPAMDDNAFKLRADILSEMTFNAYSYGWANSTTLPDYRRSKWNYITTWTLDGGIVFRILEGVFEVVTVDSPESGFAVGQMRDYSEGEQRAWGDDWSSTLTLSIEATIIGSYCFRAWNKIQTVNMTNNVTDIHDYAFAECNGIISVTLASTLKTIGYHAFYTCDDLTYIDIPDEVTFIDSYAFCGCNILSTVSLGNKVETIGAAAFKSCPQLRNIEFPASLRTIGNDAFDSCVALQTISIPEGVQVINKGAFSNCTSLAFVHIPDSVTEIGEYAFQSCTSLTSQDIPLGVVTIGDYAFSYCTALETIVLYEGLRQIGSHAFYLDSALDGPIQIPETVTTIEDCAFYGCSLNGYLDIGHGVKTIGFQAFGGCVGQPFGELSFGEDLTSIGAFAFQGMKFMGGVVFDGGQPVIGDSAFEFNQSAPAMTYYVKSDGWADENTFPEFEFTKWNYIVFGEKSFMVKVEGDWREASVYFNFLGEWKQCVPYIKVGGVWR